MNVVKKKKITIATSGPLRIKGGINGPIDIPYMEKVSLIAQMLMNKYKVYEHLADGTKILLNFQNYNTENNKEGKAIHKVVSEVKDTTDKKKLTFVNKIEEAQKQQSKAAKIGIDVYKSKTF